MTSPENPQLSGKIYELAKLHLFLTIHYGMLVINRSKEQEIQNVEKFIASENKDAVAQNNLGVMYYEGKGITQDYARARECFEEAVKLGNTNAQNNLGLMYINKVGIPYNIVKAKECFEKAAKLKNANAQFNLGVMYYEEHKGLGDYTKTRKWIGRAADQGHADAEYSLGVLYCKGYQGLHDFNTARKWIGKAADQGHANAQHDLGVIHLEGYIGKHNYPEAKKWLEKAANQEIANAQFNLGIMYLEGLGVPITLQNNNIARKWFNKAAMQGHVEAQYNLGLIYDQGLHATQNHTTAKEWYEKAANQGHVQAQYNLGLMYYQNKIETRDYTIAKEWLEKAATQGYVESEYTLGMIYDQALHTSQDLYIARQWYEKAAIKGHAQAKNALDKILRIIQEQNSEICTEPLNDAIDIEETKRDMDVPIDLTDIFSNYSQEELERAKAFLDLPVDDQNNILNAYNSRAKESKTPQVSIFEKVKSEYNPFPENHKITVDNVLAHLKPQLAPYVKAWGANEDLLYLDDFRQIEPLSEKIYQAFYREHKRAEKEKRPSPLLSDLIPTQDKKTDKQLENFKPTKETTSKEYQQVASAKYYREKIHASENGNHPEQG